MSTPTRPSSASASGASAEAVLRRLETWAQADDQAAEEESSEGQAVVATGTLDGKLTLTAVSRDGPPPGGLAPHAPVTSRYELEAYVLDAGRALRARSQALHVWELERLQAQQDCCEELSRRSTLTLEQLQSAAEECERVKRETAPMLAESEAQVRRRREEEALEDALNEQLKPLREARAVAQQLEAGFDDTAAHSTSHPVVAALRVLDRSEAHLAERPHWRDSSKYASELNTLRCRVLRLAAAHVNRPVLALLSQLLAEQRAAAAAAAAAPAATNRRDDEAAGGAVEGGAEAATAAAGAGAAAAAAALEEAPYVRFQALALQVHPHHTPLNPSPPPWRPHWCPRLLSSRASSRPCRSCAHGWARSSSAPPPARTAPRSSSRCSRATGAAATSSSRSGCASVSRRRSPRAAARPTSSCGAAAGWGCARAQRSIPCAPCGEGGRGGGRACSV